MKRILVIEDDTEQRELFKDALEEAGHEVIEAQDGEVGLRLFRQQPCDLVITDIFMPEKEGLETLLELKKEFPGVKIIAISGGGTWLQDSETVLEAAKRLGADRILHKPIIIHHLLETVDEVLRTL